ncbi:MAG: methylmalonyl-CoA mutase family protein [Ilumatobacteraceae bacterium]
MTAAGSSTENSTSESPPREGPTRQQWVRLAAKALKRDFGPADDAEQIVNRLRSTTYDGIVIEPLYSAGDADTRPHARVISEHLDGWDVRQIVDAVMPAFSAVDELERGATSLLLRLTGLDSIDTAAIAQALDGVYLDLTSITLDAGDRWADAAEALLQLWADSNVGDDAARGSFGADPAGTYASNGGTSDVDGQLATVAALVERIAGSHPNVRTITIDATRFHEAGASDGQELGFGIAAAVHSVRALTEAGIDIATAFGQIELRLAATADQFSTIAKFRAARRLWARIGEVAGAASVAASTPIHAVTSAAMMSRYDPWVNLLRGTIACFGAGIGGADAITVLPYDAEIDPSGSELGRRIARNTQSILTKESNLSRVADPGGGSFYVESLTDQLSDVAWTRFQEVERAGGFVAAVDAGTISTEIAAAWGARRRNLVSRRDPLTGVSEFPNVAETPPAGLPDAPVVAANALPRHRYSEPFDELRSRVDHVAAVGARPSLFLANIGSAAVHTARASFAKNLFEIAGIVTVASPGSNDPAEIGEQFTASGAAVACICSSDRVYADCGVAVVAALRERGAAAVYLAGKPNHVLDDLTAAGVDVFVTAGADVEQILSDLLLRLDVP